MEHVVEINVSDIVISSAFSSTIPNEEKYNRHLEYYLNNNDIAKQIIVDWNNVLRDGYIDYLILKSLGVSKQKCYVTDKPVSLFTRKIRRLVWEKSNGECASCGKKLNLKGRIKDDDYMTIDHIFPESLGGSSKLENLQAMCADCNVAKGNAIL